MAKCIPKFEDKPAVSLYIIYSNRNGSVPHPITLLNPHVVIFTQEEDFQDMIDLAETMERQCSHLFDRVIVNGDIAVAFRELKADLERLEEAEIQWIPAEWAGSLPAAATAAARRTCSHLGGWI